MTETPRADQLPFFPRFFVAGAPRCGTTSISKYLSWHPEICFSRPKEVHYFNRDPDLSVDALRRNYLERYFSHFDAARHRVAGEGSVSYLYDPDAIRRILAIQPEARFIDDLGADSLDTVELVMDLEEQFNITIPEEDQEKLRTVLWGFSGRRLPTAQVLGLRRLRAALSDGLGGRVEDLLSADERDALESRVDRLLEEPIHPAPPHDRPPLPWPPY